MERADLSGIPVAVTEDHPSTWESMKDFQWHVKDFSGCSSLDRSSSSQSRRDRERKKRTMMKEVRTMREVRTWTWTVQSGLSDGL